MKQQFRSRRSRPAKLAGLLLATTAISGAMPALAQDTAKKDESKSTVEKITVTSQKRAQQLQDVPASVQAISTKKIEELQISDINDYAKHLPNVTIQPSSPGFVGVYMRGVASGENRNHSGPSPSVGMYLDEIPITTIQGALDVHVYDIARVEALAGPQGTLYGANSQAGTIRIITNKPDTVETYGSATFEVNAVDHGGIGSSAEGFVNVPLSDKAAVRIVGWGRHDAGYIDNVFGTRLYPTSGVLDNNADRAKDDYNTVDTYGARAALKIELDENWTLTPVISAQDQKTEGIFAYSPSIGDLQVTHWFPENSHDRWVLAAATVEGKVSNLDVTLAGGYLDRTVDSNSDYADYGFFYDTVLGYGNYFNSNGNPGAPVAINPAQYIQARDGYNKESIELRVATPAENALRFIGGVFYQRQEHEIFQRYRLDGFFDGYDITGLPDTIWLTSQLRIDIDRAIFGEVAYDLTDKLTATLGLRFFEAENSLEGFFGFSTLFAADYGVPTLGEASCFAGPMTASAPCTNLNKLTTETGNTRRVNLAYEIDDKRMVYATYSTGYRPGGVNRRGTLPPYASDYLTNYEVGWKTMLADDTLRFNGALFWQEWEDFQFSFLGLNGLTQIQNAGQATIKGIEADIEWKPIQNLSLSVGATLLDTEFQGGPGFPPATSGLPVTPKFKGNLTARYEYSLFDHESFVQGTVVHSSDASIDLRATENAIIGKLPAYTLVDLSTGMTIDGLAVSLYLSNAFDERALVGRYTQCAITVCGGMQYDTPMQPRTIGIKATHAF
jgi:outer membrane receptor protein involved in Fe transport